MTLIYILAWDDRSFFKSKMSLTCSKHFRFKKRRIVPNRFVKNCLKSLEVGELMYINFFFIQENIDILLLLKDGIHAMSA